MTLEELTKENRNRRIEYRIGLVLLTLNGIINFLIVWGIQ